jgi:hypothetical protein
MLISVLSINLYQAQIKLPMQSRHGGIAQGQVIPQIDPRKIGSAFHGTGAEIAKKGLFWMETN